MRLFLLLCLALSACTESALPSTPLADAAEDLTPGIDAGSVACSESADLQIGHCIDKATGAPCRNFESTTRDYVGIEPETVIPQIVGFQGSPMFVMALRISNMDEPADARPPLVQLEVNIGAAFVGGYTSRPTLVVDPLDSADRLAAQLYVVTLLGDAAIDQRADIVAKVASDTGREWCAKTSFVIGATINE